jgi:hypothetical protein
MTMEQLDGIAIQLNTIFLVEPIYYICDTNMLHKYQTWIGSITAWCHQNTNR